MAPVLTTAFQIVSSSVLFIQPWGAAINVIKGTAADDVKFGTALGDEIALYAGADLGFGSGGVDYIYGGLDNDNLYGGPNSDVLKGSQGSDALYGGDSKDVLVGGRSTSSTAFSTLSYPNDIEHGGNGRDYLRGSGGNDKLFGEAGNDRVLGGPGDDYLALGAHGPLVATSALSPLNPLHDPGYEEARPGNGKDTMVLSPIGKGKDVVRYFGSKLKIDHANLPTTSFDVIKNFDAAQDSVSIALEGLFKSQFTTDATQKEFLFLTVSGTKKKVFRIVNGDVPALLTAKKIAFV